MRIVHTMELDGRICILPFVVGRIRQSLRNQAAIPYLPAVLYCARLLEDDLVTP